MKLKPCSFCGQTDLQLGIYKHHFFVFCLYCPNQGPRKFNKDLAIKAWNRRARPRKGKVKK